MGKFLLIVVSLVAALHTVAVYGQESAPAAIRHLRAIDYLANSSKKGRCTNEIRNKFSTLGCPDASAAPCFCKNPTFSSAILECSVGRGATADQIADSLRSGFCLNQELAKAGNSAAPSTPAAASSTSPTSTSAAAATSPASSSTAQTPSSTSIASQTVLTTSSTSLRPTTSSSAITSPSTASSSSAAPTSTSASSTTSSGPTTTSNVAASATTSSAAGATKPNGLSQAAVAGIGIGIGAAVIAVAGIVICMLLRGRRNNRHRNPDQMEISKPLPGSGRMYATREDQYRGGRDASMEKYGHEIEMTSHRYEDMIPRTQPRTMV
ncbi:hypothetical protein AAL_05308 [Moelleriella libera RCEF 2490]|uniref:Extracellular membrane protein, CFEM domain protein n=1 Tax=Moelleriella libera RCEF 2490 TaxID=1081109 RepID=A0A168ATR7_9HYPO|nr:hypothetical protein AAL_05308 [Moelleriella libera RCEF 2490]